MLADVKLSLKSQKMINDVDSLLDEVLPLNMTYVVSIIWNMHKMFEKHTYAELGGYTQREMREKII